ncbi:hypothetical protein SUGI_1203730 [Cryptomeria japonica]|nr:hypothetical protein SUGI_1203730 [Cryptomeria japonica]
MEEKINAWIANNRDTAAELGLKIKDCHKEFVNFEVGGYIIQLTMPPVSNFEDTARSDNVNSDSAFVALSIEEEDDETLMNILEALNEKLERVRIPPDCINKVLDIIAELFGRNSKKQNEQEHQALEESYLYRLVENARMQCEMALAEALEYSNTNGILPRCSVKLNPELEAVELQMDIKAIMSPDHVIKALGFCFDQPLNLYLTFDGGKLYEKEAIFLGSVDVFVKHGTANILQTSDSLENLMSGMDEGVKHAIVKSCIASMRPYGPHVLVPQFVKEFMHSIKIGHDNIFVDLLLSLGSWLRMLKNWCVFCKSPIPSFSRLWFCDVELCLYRFEELGIGASVLQELQNTEVIDLELNLAAAATRNKTRDVFEPYPAFLLKKIEIRNRSGFFSNCTSEGRAAIPDMENKNLELLGELIDSFLPLSEMQKCSSESELVLKLGMSWLQKNNKSTGKISSIKANLSPKDFVEKMWLPYKILRYVLFTNRLSLCLLPDSHRLNIDESLYQFAVFYNSESEQNFEQRRETEGSVFAFHGSHISNWYSIIRNGLRCLSNTKYMSSGKAYGEGIYFSTEMNYSYQHARSVPTEYSVLALCEIFSGVRKYQFA